MTRVHASWFYPNEIPSSRSFDFTIKTGFWHSESDEFKITHFEDEGAYKWLEVTVDSSANLTFPVYRRLQILAFLLILK